MNDDSDIVALCSLHVHPHSGTVELGDFQRVQQV